MIIYEVQYTDGILITTKNKSISKSKLYFSNKVKAKSFIAQNKKKLMDLEIKKHIVDNSKIGVLNFINRNNTINS